MNNQDTSPGIDPQHLKFYEGLPDNYLVLSPNLSILTASDAYLHTTGKLREEITGRPLFDVFPKRTPWAPGEDSGISRSLEEVLRTGSRHELPPTRFDTPDGTFPGKLQERYWKTLHLPVKAASGELLYIIHRTEEVTHLVLKEEQLTSSLAAERAATAKAQALSQQMERLFHDIPAQIAILRGRDLVYDYVNPQYHRELFPGREVLGLPLLVALPEVKDQPVWHILQKVYASGEPFIENELLIQLAPYEGGPLADHYFNTVYQPLRDEKGETYAMLSFKYEVTTHVAARRKLEASELHLKRTNRELSASFEELQAVHEELGAANEELVSSNEEILRTQEGLSRFNSELEALIADRTRELAESVEEQQALNEEINAANEELTAINEELLATNDELNQSQRSLEHALKGLTESDQRFRNLVRDATVGIILLTGEEMRVQIVNDAYGRLIGRKVDELDGRLLFEEIPETENDFRPIIEGVRLSGAPVYMYDTPYLVYADGQTLQGFLNLVYQPYREADGSITGVMVLCQDVTEQVNARLKLEESEKRFRFLLNSIPQQVWTATPEGALNYVNQVVEADFGYDNEAIVGHGWQKFIHPDDLPRCLKAWMASLANGSAYSIEFRLLFKDGHYYWHLARAQPYSENGQVTLWLGTNTNIELQKTNEQKKDEFLSIASHELRTPLTSIKAFNQVMQRMPYPPQMAGFMKKSADHIFRLEKLISDLLDVTRINAGKMTYTMESFHFAEMVTASVEAAQFTAPDHELIIEHNADVVYTGDRIRLEQVMQNFLSNAVKYSPEGKRVLVNAKVEDYAIVVSVRDFGIGVSTDHLDKLFDRYYRVDNTSMRFEGLGLGLFISSEILRRHNGAFWAESRRGEGSTFYFRLPLTVGAQAQAS